MAMAKVIKYNGYEIEQTTETGAVSYTLWQRKAGPHSEVTLAAADFFATPKAAKDAVKFLNKRKAA